jgi:hypothetical protein
LAGLGEEKKKEKKEKKGKKERRKKIEKNKLSIFLEIMICNFISYIIIE